VSSNLTPSARFRRHVSLASVDGPCGPGDLAFIRLGSKERRPTQRTQTQTRPAPLTSNRTMPIDREVKKQLDAVVGESYEPPRSWKATLGKWLAFAVLAIAASAAIVSILHTHVMKAQTAPPPPAAKKPAPPVWIVPTK
jgi:hypothetical protein